MGNNEQLPKVAFLPKLDGLVEKRFRRTMGGPPGYKIFKILYAIHHSFPPTPMSPTTIPLSLDSSGSEQDLLENDPISSANTSFDEHSLTGFGDISHSEINFMPSLPSEIIAERSPSHRRNAKRPLPPTFRKATAKKLEELEDFTSLFESLRDLRDERNGESPTPFVDAEKFQPRLPTHRKGTVRKIPAPLQISKEASQVSTDPSSPISPSKPFRGSAPLPRRSPLPRWDLLDPDVYLEGKQYKIRSS